MSTFDESWVPALYAHVVITLIDGSDAPVRGMGFCLGPRSLLTARHVVDPQSNPGDPIDADAEVRLSIAFSKEGGGDTFANVATVTGKVVPAKSALDIALIQLTEDLPDAAVATSVQLATATSLTGHCRALGVRFGSGTTGGFPTRMPETIGGEWRRESSSAPELTIIDTAGFSSWGGFSGTAVFSTDSDQIIGVLAFDNSESQNRAYVVPSSAILVDERIGELLRVEREPRAVAAKEGARQAWDRLLREIDRMISEHSGGEKPPALPHGPLPRGVDVARTMRVLVETCPSGSRPNVATKVVEALRVGLVICPDTVLPHAIPGRGFLRLDRGCFVKLEAAVAGKQYRAGDYYRTSNDRIVGRSALRVVPDKVIDTDGRSLTRGASRAVDRRLGVEVARLEREFHGEESEDTDPDDHVGLRNVVAYLRDQNEDYEDYMDYPPEVRAEYAPLYLPIVGKEDDEVDSRRLDELAEAIHRRFDGQLLVIRMDMPDGSEALTKLERCLQRIFQYLVRDLKPEDDEQ